MPGGGTGSVLGKAQGAHKVVGNDEVHKAREASVSEDAQVRIDANGRTDTVPEAPQHLHGLPSKNLVGAVMARSAFAMWGSNSFGGVSRC